MACEERATRRHTDSLYQFLWAPLLDVLRGPQWGYRAWIVSMLALMAAALLPLIWIDPVDGFNWWRGLLVIHAVAASTQDVAIDALAIWILVAMAAALGLRQEEPTHRADSFGGALAAAARMKTTWIGLAFALISAAAFEATGQLAAAGH